MTGALVRVPHNGPAILFPSFRARLPTAEYGAYPGTGHASEKGEGAAHGNVVNCPQEPGTGDDAFVTLYEDVLVPCTRAPLNLQRVATTLV